MGNGEWGMGDGGMGNGGWGMGEWRMGDGGWGNGEWGMGDGGWGLYRSKLTACYELSCCFSFRSLL